MFLIHVLWSSNLAFMDYLHICDILLSLYTCATYFIISLIRVLCFPNHVNSDDTYNT